MSPERVEIEVDGRRLTLTNLEKVFYPSVGFTKGEMIDYYARISEMLLPHVRNRPITLKRFPNGVEGMSFFEKHAPSHKPDWVRTAEIPSFRNDHAPIRFAVICDRPTVIWMANLAAIELHVPLWRISEADDGPLPPDYMVFDLDPGPGTTIVDCCSVATWIADQFDRDHVYPKTSGSKGLQLYVPISGLTSEQSTEQAHQLARSLEHEHPDKVVSNMRKELRLRKVLIDWSQNSAAKTTVAPYSLRARPEPTVSTPVTWQEIESCLQAGDPDRLRFIAQDVLERLEKLGDLFAPLASSHSAP